jgi:hypothetical protein
MGAKRQFLIDGVKGCIYRILGVSKNDRFAGDQYFATFVRLVITAQNLDQSRLASTVLTQQCVNFTLPHGHINVLEGYNTRKRLADMSQFEYVLTQTHPNLLPTDSHFKSLDRLAEPPVMPECHIEPLVCFLIGEKRLS